ncbi:hypothetical protein acdb102_27680 [Acidothermaceae bacterium B102]|nr:hypothetical protein acdb102_27680 [Acidothermaceae bacterium B102]
MSRLADEINTLVDSTAGGQLHTFEPVRAKRRQLVRRRYLKAAGASLAVAAVVGYQLQDDGRGPKAVPGVVTPTDSAPSPRTTPVALQTGGMPHLAGTVWAIDRIGSSPGSNVSGGGVIPSYLFPEIRFSNESNGLLTIGNATSTVHLAVNKDKDTVRITEGEQVPLNISEDVLDAEGAVTRVIYNELKIEPQLSGTQLQLVSLDGYTMHLTRLDPVGPLGRPGDKAWSVRSITSARGTVTVAPSLNARFRLDTASEGQFAVGANNDLVVVLATAGKVQLSPLPFSGNKAKPGELTVTQALQTLSGPLSATQNGRTLILTSATGVRVTMVSTG